MAAPQQQQPAQQGPISNDDVAEWSSRFNDVVARPSEYLNSKSPESAQPWFNSFFGCFAPIDTCLLSWCLPCVVFGRTHHRLRKNPNLEGFQPINTSCLLFCASSCVAGHVCLTALQRADLRTKHNLQGSCLVDLATACCCGCCDIAQQDKEAEYREALLAGNQGGVQQQYQAGGGMSYPEQK
ncbi:hypothetical protein NEMBOFW57_008789 [Staphylotrichum longicolle]|uniref:Uncharacterized protein n=1 Tax=Staphylotrichum longicolle TaxID=669026 RepID=A0AAD4EW99_9PEZI|nr:hypothetical protein NEMBOFW57_008789 [Staphylotrichum longicolle]